MNSWMKGNLTIEDKAGIVSGYLPIDESTIVAAMEKGCENLSFNRAVWGFAAAQKAACRKTALVTTKMDVFTNVDVPSRDLDKLFDAILNSFDFRKLRKEFLWLIAFKRLGNGIDYSNSLLIEVRETELTKFRSLGGHAYQYSTAEHFQNWPASIPWSNNE